MPQDLHTLYVYWDFCGLRNQIVKDFLNRVKPEYRLSIRLCRLTQEDQQYVAEREVYLEQIATGNYYFYHLNPIETYCFELGAKKPDGGFICFYQTQAVRLQPSEDKEVLATLAEQFNLMGQDSLVVALEKPEAAEYSKQLIAMSSWS
jgi:hypothetical protein